MIDEFASNLEARLTHGSASATRSEETLTERSRRQMSSLPRDQSASSLCSLASLLPFSSSGAYVDE